MSTFLPLLACMALPLAALAATEPPVFHQVSDATEPMQTGKFAPTWESLTQYETPEWFRDAKFGIWAHWGPQCAPEQGDWYARNMYIQGQPQYDHHLKNYGHPADT